MHKFAHGFSIKNFKICGIIMVSPDTKIIIISREPRLVLWNDLEELPLLLGLPLSLSSPFPAPGFAHSRGPDSCLDS